MKGVRLAIALLRIPRLFASLLLFPLLISCILIFVQLITTGAMVGWLDQNQDAVSKRIQNVTEHSFTRKIIFGSSERLPEVEICRWTTILADDGNTYEIPPSDSCKPDRLDIAIHVNNPKKYDVTTYQKIFNGNYERIHICKSNCKPDTIINLTNNTSRTDTYSVPALILLNQAQLEQAMGEEYLNLANSRLSILDNVGKIYLHAPGYQEPILLNSVTYEAALIVSIASIIIIGLWLALRAHRKVLDYFSQSGALLPMVASLGKQEFYSALWLITLIRVIAFFLAAVPATLVIFAKEGSEIAWEGLFQKDIWHITLWLIALATSFGLAALISSIADLKHRHSLLSFMYTYLPMLIAFIGSFIWLVTFLMPGNEAAIIRSIVTALPIVSMGPMLLAPIFQPNIIVLAVNSLLCVLFLTFLAKANVRWFAAHLEEL